MTEWKLKTPVALIIFNRPDTTAKVFEVIRQVKPPQLFVVAEGPRADRADDAEKCAATRAIIDLVDWDCEVLKNYSEVNLGCAKRPSTGIDWVFDTVEEAIILEDDCLPHPTFFRFCDELLDRYRHDERVMTVCGLNLQFGRRKTEYSYYFSRYNPCWGWASWRRAWKYFDFDMKLWPKARSENFLGDILLEPYALKVWTKIFQDTYEGKVNCWDYQWVFATMIQNGLAIIPNVNLISNIGHGTGATHTTDEKSIYSDMAVEAVSFPLIHPRFVVRDVQADDFAQNTFYDHQPPLPRKIKKKINKMLGLKYELTL